MLLTVSNEVADQVFGPLELSSDMTLMDLIALLELDCAFDESKHELYYNMKKLDTMDVRPIKDIFHAENELLLIRGKPSMATDIDSGNAFIESFRQELLRNQTLRSQLSFQVPQLDQIINNQQEFRERLGPFILERRNAAGRSGNNIRQGGTSQNPFNIPQTEYLRLMSDPDSPENQKRISELINQQEIEEQFHNAWEYTPEVFTTVHMLYISIEINGHPVKAFVDTGAEMTIISTRLAEETGLTRLIDKRFIGEARGVGTSKILGRIHQAQIKIETQYIPCTLTVLDTHVDMLFGLDMLKRHRATIDLGKDVLKIADVETKFLGEAEIPKSFLEDIKMPADAANQKFSNNTNSSVNRASALIPPANNQSATKKQTADNVEAPSVSSNVHPESKITQLMGLGFSRPEVIRALDKTNGNAEFAASLLFQ